jgi:hypothetical protein
MVTRRINTHPQRKVFHSLLTLPKDFVARRDTNRGRLTTSSETVVHDIFGQEEQEQFGGGCMRTLSITMSKHAQRPATCTPIDVFDFVILRVYVNNNPEPSIEVVVNHLFGIHHSDAVTVPGRRASKRRTMNNYLYSITANGAMILKIPAPFASGIKITMTKQNKNNAEDTLNNIINFWSFLDYEEYPIPGSLQEPLRLHIREGVLDAQHNQLRLAHAYNQRGYLLGFTMGVELTEEGKHRWLDGAPLQTQQTLKLQKLQLPGAAPREAVDKWFHNGGEMLVLDQTDPKRASLIHGIGAEDAFFETCSPLGGDSKQMHSDTHGFQYALDKDRTGITSALDRVDYVSAYRAFLDHDVIPFQKSFALHMGNTKYYEYSSVTYWYGSSQQQPSSSSSKSKSIMPLVDTWQVCGQQSFLPSSYMLDTYKMMITGQQPMTKDKCKEIYTGSDEFLDLMYTMIKPGSISNAENQRVSVYATISYERIEVILSSASSSSSSSKILSCIQLEIFHDDFTLVWLVGELIYLGETRRGHGVSLSDPFQPNHGEDVEMAILMANTENNNFRAWLLGVTARPISCDEERQFADEGLPLPIIQNTRPARISL